MKKSILALAVLGAFAGAASAQSSVTLYGRAEANVTYSKPGDRIAGGDERWRMYDGAANSGIGGSRWGLRGTEDLGGGLRAYFVLESGFNLDSGGTENSNNTGVAGDGRTFGRQAYVAVGSKTLGDVRLGRQESFSRLINSGFTDASAIGELKIDEGVLQGNQAVTAAAPLGVTTARQLFQTFGQRVDNAFQYKTPSFGGFEVAAMVGAGEASTARYQGIMGSYSGGPIKVALGYESYDKFGARTSEFNKVINVGGSYNFGFAQLFAGYQDSTDVGAATGAALTATSVQDQQVYNVGVMVPVGSLQIRAQYTNADYDLVNGASRDIQKYGLSARYLLSKRTTLYSAITERAGSDGADDLFVQKREITLLGLAHTF